MPRDLWLPPHEQRRWILLSAKRPVFHGEVSARGAYGLSGYVYPERSPKNSAEAALA